MISLYWSWYCGGRDCQLGTMLVAGGMVAGRGDMGDAERA